MIRPRWILVTALIGLTPGLADEARGACLTAGQQREAVAGRSIVPLARVKQAIKARGAGDVVRARLCDRGKGLVYVLTVLSHDGKVTQATIDAASGQPVGGS